MKAAVLEKVGIQPVIKDIPEPDAGPGEAVVRTLAAPVLSYAREIFDGTRGYPLLPPLVPGCGAIGEVLKTGLDATRLKPGMRVYCSPIVRSRDATHSPHEILQGTFGGNQDAQRLMSHFRNGPFAEQMMLPLENALPLGPAAGVDAAKLCYLNTLLVPYGGLLRSGLKPGETVLINGASGHFGGAGVAVALAMGARKVIATARNINRLNQLVEKLGNRVMPVALTGNEDQDLASIAEASDGCLDKALDLLPPVQDTSPIRTAIRALRPKGELVLMGGVLTDVQLPYPEIMLKGLSIHGRFMYDPDAPERLFGLVAAGLLPLSLFQVESFRLDQFDEATLHAAQHTGPFSMTVIEP